MISDNKVASYEAFQDSLSTTVIAKLAPSPGRSGKKRAIKGRKNEIKPVAKIAQATSNDASEDDAGELSEFVEVC